MYKNKDNNDYDDYNITGDETDFLQIKPGHNTKRKHRDDHYSAEGQSRRKHSSKDKYRESRDSDEERRREQRHHRSHHHHHRRKHRHQSNSNSSSKHSTDKPLSIMDEKQFDSCKYDVEKVKDIRICSNHESENHRHEPQIKKTAINNDRNLSEILQADFDDDAESEKEEQGNYNDKIDESDLDSNNDESDESSSSSSKDEEKNVEKKSSDNSDTDTNPNSPQIKDDEDNYPSPLKDENFTTTTSTTEAEKSEIKPSIDHLPPYFPAIEGCRGVEEFQCLNRIAEGAYGVVYRFKDKRTDDIVALKKLKMEKEKEGFPITSLREINTLLKGQHPNIVTVREIVMGSNMDKIFIVMDYVEHDLKSLIEMMRKKNQTFTPGEVKCLLKQLLSAVAHLHDNWILHRDLKTSNLLLSHKGVLKVGDFGLAREYGSPLRPYTPVVVTLWYRAPELLLCSKEYSSPIDMWSVGCIFAELLLMNAFFTGQSEIEQINKYFKCLGTPSEKTWPGYNKLPAVQKMKFNHYPMSNLRKKFQMLSNLGMNLLLNFLTFDPSQRITAEDALTHSYFNEIPIAIDPQMFPTWPAKSEMGHNNNNKHQRGESSPKPPSGGGEFKKLGGDEDGFRIALETDNRERIGAGFSLKF